MAAELAGGLTPLVGLITESVSTKSRLQNQSKKDTVLVSFALVAETGFEPAFL